MELKGFSPTLVVLDSMDKATGVKVLQLEMNDFLGIVIKVTGPTASVRAALDAAQTQCDAMHCACVSSLLARPDARAWPAIEAPREFNPLLEQD